MQQRASSSLASHTKIIITERKITMKFIGFVYEHEYQQEHRHSALSPVSISRAQKLDIDL